MRYIAGKKVIAKFHARRIIGWTYHGLRLVWQRVKDAVVSGSCFGSGYWIDENPWLDEDGWNDNV